MGMLVVVGAIMAAVIGLAGGLGGRIVSLLQQVFDKAVQRITSA
jgi:hypothetical protein